MSNDEVQYFTKKGLEDLKTEFNELRDKQIPDLANLIDEAKQQGDLSENAEYDQAKDDMAWAQGRLREITYFLDHAKVVESVQKKNDTVIVGNTVVVKTKTSTKSYTIVGPQEADPLQGKISNESPLGGSFLGHKVGDEVSVSTPAGKQTYKIMEIS